MTNKFQIALLRYPCVMEDEGDFQLVGAFGNWQDALTRLEEFTGGGEGYFKYADVGFLISGAGDSGRPSGWPSECKPLNMRDD